MTRDDDSIGGTVKAAVSLVVSGVAEKNTECRTRRKLVSDCGSEVWVASTTKDSNVIVRRRHPVKSGVWCSEP